MVDQDIHDYYLGRELNSSLLKNTEALSKLVSRRFLKYLV